ncbi:MAG: universal stress protein [Planctomycetota bacterium]|jgi:nucleotide-binding universal stress UspA family protein
MSLNLKRILVAVDFSETSHKAFDYALSLAKAFEAEIIALHVLEDPILYAPTTDQSYRDAYERALQGKLEGLVNRHGVEGVRVTTVMKQGAPFVEIIRHAQAGRCDLIVMGTLGHGPIKHMLLGSVAEKVVRKSRCPVLVVRPDEHEFVSP